MNDLSLVKKLFKRDEAKAQALRIAKQAGLAYEIAVARGGESVSRRGMARRKPNAQKYSGGRFARQVIRRQERAGK